VRWLGQDGYLKRDNEDAPWIWHSDVALDRASAAARSLLTPANDDATEANPTSQDKENQALAPCETQVERSQPTDELDEGPREKGKARAAVEAEWRVVDGLDSRNAGEGSSHKKARKGPRRSLFEDLTKSATASPAALDSGPVVKRGAGGSSQEGSKEVAPAGAGEDNLSFYE